MTEEEPTEEEPTEEEPTEEEPASEEPASEEPTNEEPSHGEAPQQEGLSWSWDLDLDAVLTAVGGRAAPAGSGPRLDEDERADADLAEYLEARDSGRTEVVPLPVVAGRVAESLPTGPGLAGWLACGEPGGLDEWALPGVAASYRRLAAWAQAGELAAVAQLASRSAASDDRVGAAGDGRPDKVTPDACGQVALALTMSQSAASWWTDLAVTLRWRLPGTGAALRSGDIDLARARMIAEATSVLDEDKARAVEAKILPKAGHQTLGQLRSALRRAVIAADPEGADERRQEAERRARVTLYPDEEGTASLAGYNLPGVRAAAAMARITALARALKASGADGGIDLLRSKVLLGLLLGTLPYIPPPPAGPHDHDLPPDSAPPDSGPPEDGTPSAPAGAGPADPTLDERLPEDAPPEGDPSDDDLPDDEGGMETSGTWFRERSASGENEDEDEEIRGRPITWPRATAFFPPAPGALANLPPTEGGLLDLRIPWSALVQNSGEPGSLARLGPITPSEARYLARLAARDPTVRWRVIVTGPDGRAIAVTRIPSEPAKSRSSRASPPGQPEHRASDAASHGSLIGRVTVIISRDDLSVDHLNVDHLSVDHLSVDHLSVDHLSPDHLNPDDLSPDGPFATDPSGEPPDDHSIGLMLERILSFAGPVAERATARAAADASVPGGCAHGGSSAAYRPPASLREYIMARDLTCRFPTCRQPAVRCDLDHTRPYDEDGPTCGCNLGSLCRHHHHELKQHARWRLEQPEPGTFIWTTPAGRAYTTQPDQQAA